MIIDFFFNTHDTTDNYTLSLHDAHPIYGVAISREVEDHAPYEPGPCDRPRSEEHTSELQSPCNIVCRLMLEKKNYIIILIKTPILYHSQDNNLSHTLIVYNDAQYTVEQH